MSRTEDRIRAALAARAGTPEIAPMPARAHHRVRVRQVGLATAFGSLAAALVAFAVVAYGTVGGSSPEPTPTFDPAADGYTSRLEDVPPGWPSVDIHDPEDAFVPALRGVRNVVDGPTVLASGEVDDSRFTLYAYTVEQDAGRRACLGFVGFAAPGAATKTAPASSTCVDASGAPDGHDVAFVGAHSEDRPDLEANLGFASSRTDVVYVWGGDTFGMFEMPLLRALDGWDVFPFFFVPRDGAGPLEADARLHGEVMPLAHADICDPSTGSDRCAPQVVQELPLTSPVDVPIPLPAGEWPEVTYGGDFEPYIDHEANAEGVVDPGVVGEKRVIAYGTVQGAPWSLVAYNTRFAGAPDGLNPTSDLEITGVGGGGAAALYETAPWQPNDLSASRMHGGGDNFDSVAGVVSARVATVHLELSDATVRTPELIAGPSEVAASYFVIFIPHQAYGRLVAVDGSGQEVEQMCLRDMTGVPPGGDPCA